MQLATHENAVRLLRENLELLSDSSGHISEENRPLWNISGALIVLLEAVDDLRTQSQNAKHQQ